MERLTEDDSQMLLDWFAEAESSGSLYPGMTYEEGIRDALELIDGNVTVADLKG